MLTRRQALTYGTAAGVAVLLPRAIVGPSTIEIPLAPYDCSAALQAALNAAAAGQDVVLIHAGKYTLRHGLRVPCGVSLQGVGGIADFDCSHCEGPALTFLDRDGNPPRYDYPLGRIGR